MHINDSKQNRSGMKSSKKKITNKESNNMTNSY